ncbi:LEA type 2 family protein [Pontibacter sp. CAU 1760]
MNLDLTNDTAQVKTGIQVQNRIPLPISIDSIRYTIQGDSTRLGWGQMTSTHTLPALGDKVLDFRLLLKYDKLRQHLKQQDKDSVRLAVKADVFFGLPLFGSRSRSLTKHLTVPVPKGPSMEMQELLVRDFSPEKGYSLLLKIDAANKDLPDATVQDFSYSIRIGDTLTLTGNVDSTFRIQSGGRQLQIPLHLKTSDAIALISKLLAEDDDWEYTAKLEALVKSSHRLFDETRLAVEKTGTLEMGGMGSGGSYLPSISQVKRLEVNSTDTQTLLQAAVVVHNPSPFPFYIDSATYFIRHKGLVIASGKKDYEKVLNKAGNQLLNLRLLVDESAYDQFMKSVQGQEKASLDIDLNLLYNLPDAKRQRLHLTRQLQVPVKGQARIKVTDLTVRELSPEKGASLTLHLKVLSSNLPNLTIRDLDYTLQLGQDLRLTGHTTDPISVSSEDATVEVPIHLTAENVNQLLDKALKGSINWNYDLQASALLQSTNDMIGPTRLDFDFSGELEMSKGMGSGSQFVPQISNIDSLNVYLHFDTAWVDLKINVKNPLPVAFRVDSLLLTLRNGPDTFAVSREPIGKVLSAEGEQSAWITLGINYGRWQRFKKQHQHLDSLELTETITLAYQLEDLPGQRTTFQLTLRTPTPDTPVAALHDVKLAGISLSKGVVMKVLAEVKNLNVQKLEVSGLTYNICVENLLDACGTVNRTYQVAQGRDVVSVPIGLGVGEVFRAFFAKLTSRGQPRDIFLNASGTISSSNPKLQGTFVKVEIWKEAVLFQKKGKQKQAASPAQTAAN